MKDARVKIVLMGAEATTSRRQRVLARVPSPLDLAPSGAYPTNSRRGEHRGVSGVPLRRIIVPGGMFPRDDGRRDDYGCLGFPRTMRDVAGYADLLSPHLGLRMMLRRRRFHLITNLIIRHGVLLMAFYFVYMSV